MRINWFGVMLLLSVLGVTYIWESLWVTGALLACWAALIIYLVRYRQ